MHFSPTERILALLDANTFEPFGDKVQSRYKLGKDGDGVVTGTGTINNQKVYVLVQDANYLHGSFSEANFSKINYMLEYIFKNPAPLVVIFQSIGGRIQEGVAVLKGGAIMFNLLPKLSGFVPMIAVVIGTNTGGTAYASMWFDHIIMIKQQSFMCVTGPQVVESMLNEKSDINKLGGTSLHTKTTGYCSILTDNEYEAYQQCKLLLKYYNKKNHNYSYKQKIINWQEDYEQYQTIDINKIIDYIVDDDSFLELKKDFAQNAIIGFATINGISVGVVGNQSLYNSGIFDVDACKKMAKFIQLCDAHNIPLLSLIDTPGFMPGFDSEVNGILGFGAQLVSSIANSTNIKISLIYGKAIGGGYGGLCTKSLGADLVFAYPTAAVAVVGEKVATKIIFKKEIESASNPIEKAEALKQKYQAEYMHPYQAAALGEIDAIINPEESRTVISKALFSLINKQEQPVKKKLTICCY